ncbi:MFS transporter [Kaistia dalseonensis]|uniref:MFS family arabinose efflux permease n=1 Tax=Kaistia dalseonensis TaxID=410840 RepID=A0ABU0HC02_9HYPH|nr:MFS transporter [Kaistia dalseonensis]MCX5497204.1 MFS transporter [Kaistia dalseonensis]MDQ0439835.1 putative MFS family arabinose efflux permease [Kaistia dalseonensis]
MSSSHAPDAAHHHAAHPKITPATTFLMAFACGAIAANLYYAQPLIALIGPDVGLSPHVASLIVTLTQLGYGAGLVLLVPLGDVVENKRLIISAIAVTTVALILITLAPNSALFLIAALCIGVASSAVQMLVPMAASMTDEATRGRTVGNVMSGLMVGILFARPLAGILADIAGWRGVFAFSAAMMVVVATLLSLYLPRRHPGQGQSYGKLLASLWTIMRDTPLLRRRGFYQVALFADFSLFWTAAPLELAGAPFHMSQTQIALFALAGAAGALAAPIAGRLADRGFVTIGTGIVILGTIAAFALAGLGGATASLMSMVVAAIILDLFVQSNTVFGQRVLYTLSHTIRSRLNGLYIAMFFVGGAIGSAIASPVYESYGWPGIVAAGIAFPAVAFLYYLTEFLPGNRVRA